MFQYLIKLLTLIYFALIMYIMLDYIDIESYLLFGTLFTTVRDRLVAFLRKCSYAAKNCLWHKRKRALSKGALLDRDRFR